VKTGRLANICLALFLFIGLGKLVLIVLPYPELAAFERTPCSLPVLDRNGNLLRILPLADGSRREYRSLDALPQELTDVLLASEDGNFFNHPGVDAPSLVRALVLTAREGEVVSGASTITMQLARLIRPHGQDPAGKLGEMWDALRLEARLPKKRILELWLNSLPFGNRAVGVTSAARTYFGLEPGKLSSAQVLVLAVIPRRPALYSPFAGSNAPAAAAVALGERLGLSVTPDDIHRAILASRELKMAGREGSADLAVFRAPHFVQYVAGELGVADFASGREVRTSLDAALTELVSAELNLQIKKAESNRVSNGAVMLIDNRTGEILVYVGSENFADTAHSGQIDGVRITNQPGSTLKPFLYALALESGFTAASVLPDIPLRFGGEEAYVPFNFNRRFNGPVRLRNALSSSLNIPAVYTLDKIGVPVFMRTLKELGFHSLEGQGERAGIGLAIGNAEVSLFELVQAFSVFARAGRLKLVTWKYVSADEAAPDVPARIFSPTTAGIIRDILADRKGRVTGFGSQSVLNTGYAAIFKTGTSNQFTNTWALGATPRYTVGVWMGNFSGSTVIGIPGSSKPSEVAVNVLARLAARGETFPPVPDAHQVPVCTLSGGKAKPECPSRTPEYFPEGFFPAPCTFHRKEGGRIVTVYPPEYQVWAAEYGYYHEADAGSRGTLPGERAAPVIVSPNDGAQFYFDPTIPEEDQTVRIEINAGVHDELEVTVNGERVARGPAPLVDFWPLRPGEFEISVRGRNGAARARFSVK
jgi:penicillin-binding protein 1C